MLEWITAPKKQSVLEVKLLPGDPAQEDTLIHIPYSKLIDSILADRSRRRCNSKVPRFVPSAFSSL